jgi:GrpB-like predicted nucleotidyltransferase (UPF0157 family)
VLIQEYDPAWPAASLRLAARVRTALGNLAVAVEHIGSTSVPGLAAKPIIDLDVVLASPADLPEAIRLLGHRRSCGRNQPRRTGELLPVQGIRSRRSHAVPFPVA